MEQIEQYECREGLVMNSEGIGRLFDVDFTYQRNKKMKKKKRNKRQKSQKPSNKLNDQTLEKIHA